LDDIITRIHNLYNPLAEYIDNTGYALSNALNLVPEEVPEKISYEKVENARNLAWMSAKEIIASTVINVDI